MIIINRTTSSVSDEVMEDLKTLGESKKKYLDNGFSIRFVGPKYTGRLKEDPNNDKILWIIEYETRDNTDIEELTGSIEIKLINLTNYDIKTDEIIEKIVDNKEFLDKGLLITAKIKCFGVNRLVSIFASKEEDDTVDHNLFIIDYYFRNK